MKSLGQLQHNNLDEEQIKGLLEEMELLGNSDLAKILDWTMSKVTLYQQRGVLPAPITYIGGRPIWARIQIDKFIKQGGKK